MKIVFKFIRNFLLGFLLTWYATVSYTHLRADLRPLWRKGINIEWLVNTKQGDFSDSIDEVQRDRCTYIGFRVTYTYSEPTIIRNVE